MPRFSASCRPPAPATLLITAATGMPASRIACRLLPRPEMRTTTAMSARRHRPGVDLVRHLARPHGLLAIGRPALDAELVRYHARAGTQLGAQLGAQPLVHLREQVKRHHRGFGKIGAEEILAREADLVG